MVAPEPNCDRGRRWMRSAQARRRVGRTMVSVAVVGLIMSVTGTVVAWRVAGELNGSTRATLDVTIETIDSVENSIDLADRVLVATMTSIDTVNEILAAVAESVDAGTGVVDEIDDLTSTVGPALADATVALRQLEGVGSTIDDLLGNLSSIPFGPDYRPDRGLGETIGDVADEIETLPAAFTKASTDIQVFSTALDDLQVEIGQLSRDVADVSAGLDGNDAVIDQYRRNISDARLVAVTTRERLDGDVGLIRLLLVIGGINLAVGQIVPFWIGRELLDGIGGDDDVEPSEN